MRKKAPGAPLDDSAKPTPTDPMAVVGNQAPVDDLAAAQREPSTRPSKAKDAKPSGAEKSVKPPKAAQLAKPPNSPQSGKATKAAKPAKTVKPTRKGKSATDVLMAAQPLAQAHWLSLTPDQRQDHLQERFIADWIAPDKDSPSDLWELAKPHARKEWERLVREGQKEARETIQQFMRVMADGAWPELSDIVPPGSLLDTVEQVYMETTDVAPGLPFYAAMSYVSALLLQRGVKIDSAGQRVDPSIWTIGLAPSGSGKTFAGNSVARLLGGTVEVFPAFASTAMFMETMAKHNRGLFAPDEFSDFLKSFDQPQMAEMPGYLKKVYDGEMIERNVKTQQIRVDEPALTVFGGTVVATLKDNLKRSMLVDGLAQRFAWFIAERGNRSLLAEYRGFKKASKRIVEQWASLSKTAILPRYRTSPTSSAAFQEMMDAVTARCRALNLGDGYIKRISHRGLKYALIYHVVMGKAGDVLDAEDFGYAARLCAINVRDIRRVLDLYPGPPLAETVREAGVDKQAERLERVVVFLRAQRDADMPPRTAGHLQAKVRQLRGLKAPQIRALMVQACERDSSLTPFVILDVGTPFVKRASGPAAKKVASGKAAKPPAAKPKAASVSAGPKAPRKTKAAPSPKPPTASKP